MDLLVVSDTHGRFEKINEVVALQSVLSPEFRPTYLIHLGDGASDIGRANIPQNICSFGVKGNCDSPFIDVDVPDERVFTLFGVKFVAIHGHKFYVKRGDERAVKYAIENNADVLLFGHTHRKTEYTIKKGQCVDGQMAAKDILVFNPGSLGFDNSFGIINVKKEGILASFGELRK